MNVSTTASRRVTVLVAGAVLALLGRWVVGVVSGPPVVARAGYLLALGCLLAAVLVIVDDRR